MGENPVGPGAGRHLIQDGLYFIEHILSCICREETSVVSQQYFYKVFVVFRIWNQPWQST
jgi:hypothetical protein